MVGSARIRPAVHRCVRRDPLGSEAVKVEALASAIANASMHRHLHREQQPNFCSCQSALLNSFSELAPLQLRGKQSHVSKTGHCGERKRQRIEMMMSLGSIRESQGGRFAEQCQCF